MSAEHKEASFVDVMRAAIADMERAEREAVRELRQLRGELGRTRARLLYTERAIADAANPNVVSLAAFRAMRES